MNFRNTALFALVFVAGILSASLVYEAGRITSENPLNIIKNPVETATETLAAVANGIGIEKDSPGDHIKENQIMVYDDKVIIDVENAAWSVFKNTNSMDPFLDEEANGIEVAPKDESEINIGDIISYESENNIIIHRVVGIGNDTEGTYFIAKGDNNPVQDPGKIRFEQIKGILVGIIY